MIKIPVENGCFWFSGSKQTHDYMLMTQSGLRPRTIRFYVWDTPKTRRRKYLPSRWVTDWYYCGEIEY